MIKILVVDDSALVRKFFGRILSSESDFEVAFARNGIDALGQLDVFKPDVVTLDVNMPEMDGLACLDRIMVERPCPVVMVSSLTAEGADTTLEALKLGAVDFVPKPDGAVTLHLDVFGPQFIAKVRSAAGAKLKASLRLRERIQRMTGVAPSRYKNRSGATTRVESRLKGFGLVLVGTSTGGPPALESLLMPLPATFPWPIVIAQHMPASFTGALARRLDGICALNVVEVVQGTKLEPGLAYIGRGDGDIVISAQGANLVAMPAVSEANYLWHPSTDRLVRSAMQHVSPAQLVGILMTGMGNDGAEAMTQLHTLGGRTIAEAEETAAVWGMPGELVKAGGADWIVPVQNIAEKLQQMMPFDALNPKHA